MKFYIAAHDQATARRVQAMIQREGVVFTSRWVDSTFKDFYTTEEKQNIALEDTEDVLAADALISLSSVFRVPGGKFVEVGIALGAGKTVYVIGHRENMLMWHPQIRQFDSVEDFLKQVKITSL